MAVASFLFENFDAAATAQSAAPKPKKIAAVEALPLISEQQLDAARKEGFAKGFEQGALEERGKIDREHQMLEEAKLKILQSMTSGIAALSKSHTQQLQQLNNVIPDLVMGVARQIIGRELKQTPLPAIKQMVEGCLIKLAEEPRITVYVHSELVQEIETQLRPLSQQEGYGGVLSVAPDETLAREDCRIAWKNGALERTTEQLLLQIEALMKQQKNIL